jgi:hypothetical protein
MRRLLSISVLIVLFAFVPKEKNPDFVLKVNADAIVTDNLSNVYVVDNDKFSKYDMRLKLQKEFSNKNFGDITTADVTNPLRPLLFYQEFGRIIFLDNTLSQNGEPIALEKLGYPLATLAASSYDNGLWIYDQPNYELIRFNSTLEITNRTGNLYQILGIQLQPNFMIEKDNRLFLNNPDKGVLIFDVFGTYIKTAPVFDLGKSNGSFQVADDAIIFMSEDILHSWNITTSESTEYEEPKGNGALNMRMERDAIFILDSSSVSSYLRKM